MALRWLEGFEGLGTTGTTTAALLAELRRKYPYALLNATNSASLQTGWGSIGLCAQCYQVDGDANDQFWLVLDNQDTWIFGFAIRTPAYFYQYAQPIIILYDSAGSAQGSLKFNSVGQLEYWMGNVFTKVFTSSVTFLPDQWYYVELKVNINNVTGSVALNVNGQSGGSTYSGDTQITAIASANRFRFSLCFNGLAGQTGSLDDLYVADGTAGLNTFIGPCKIETIRPNADTATIDWTPSANADHYTLVDDAGVPSGADYVSSSTLDQEDYWDYGALGTIVSGVEGVQINTVASLVVAGGTRQLKTPCSSNGTVSNGDAVALADVNHRTIVRLLTTDPGANGADWTVSAVNAAQFGVKVAD